MQSYGRKIESYNKNDQAKRWTLGTRLSIGPSKSCGYCLAKILRCSRIARSVISFCASRADMLWNFIISLSTITIDPRIMPPKTAFFRATRAPERKASSPPVTAPAMIWLMGPSYPRIPINVQSLTENKPAQSAKLPEWHQKYLRGWELFF